MQNVYEVTVFGKVFSINWEGLPESSKEYLIQNGLSQSIRDAGAIGKGEDNTVENKRALAEKRFEKIATGTMGLVAERVDSLTRRCMVLALAAGRKKFGKDKAKAEAFAEQVYQLPQVVAIAKQQLEQEAKAKAQAEQVDWADLLGG